jgi:anti-sigma B factor antagonist
MKIEVKKIEDVIIVMPIIEALDASTVGEFKHDINHILQSECHIVFDLSQVQFMDSSGVGAVLSCLRTVNSKGGDLKICAMTRPVKALFELIRMNKMFDIFETDKAAAAAF